MLEEMPRSEPEELILCSSVPNLNIENIIKCKWKEKIA